MSSRLRSRFVIGTGLALAALWVAAPLSGSECASTSTAAVTAAPEEQIAELTEHLDLSAFEPAVKRQLREALDALAAMPENAEPSALAARFGHAGMLLHAYELLRPAESYYRRATRLAPGEFRWPYFLGVVLAETGRIEHAACHLEQAVKLGPPGPGVALRLAEVRLRMGEPEAATHLLHRVASEYSECARALVGLGRAALQEDDFPAAIEYFERALEAAPRANRIEYYLGMAYRGAGDLQEARRHLGRAGDREPPTCDPLLSELVRLRHGEKAQILRALDLLEAQHPEAAIDSLRRALRLDPESFVAWINLATALRRIGRDDDALRALRRAVELDPKNPVAHTDLAQLLLAHGRTSQALHHARAAVASDEKHQPTRFTLGVLLMVRERYEAAHAEFAVAGELDPTHARSWIGDAVSLLALHRTSDAHLRLEHGHRLNPTAPLLTLSLARLLAASPRQDLRDGPRAYELARSLTEPALLVGQLETIALALAQQERCSEAFAWQQRALQVAQARGASLALQRLEGGLRHLKEGPPCLPDSPRTRPLLARWLVAASLQ